MFKTILLTSLVCLMGMVFGPESAQAIQDHCGYAINGQFNGFRVGIQTEDGKLTLELRQTGKNKSVSIIAAESTLENNQLFNFRDLNETEFTLKAVNGGLYLSKVPASAPGGAGGGAFNSFFSQGSEGAWQVGLSSEKNAWVFEPGDKMLFRKIKDKQSGLYLTLDAKSGTYLLAPARSTDRSQLFLVNLVMNPKEFVDRLNPENIETWDQAIIRGCSRPQDVEEGLLHIYEVIQKDLIAKGKLKRKMDNRELKRLVDKVQEEYTKKMQKSGMGSASNIYGDVCEALKIDK